MNISEFNKNIYDLNKDIYSINHCLRYHLVSLENKKDVEEKMRNIFSQMIKLLNQSDSYQGVEKNWHLAYYVQEFNKLYSKFSKATKFFGSSTLLAKQDNFQSLRNDILISLKQRSTELSRFFESRERLPFAEKDILEENLKSIKKNLSLATFSDPIFLEKEYFHLLADRFDFKNLPEVDLSPYEGNHVIRGLLSWKKILSALIREGQLKGVDNTRLEEVKAILKRGIPLANQLYYLHSLPQIKNSTQEKKLKKAYYKNFIKFSKQEEKASLSKRGSYKNQFLKKYDLKDSFHLCSIPICVLINRVVWPILDRIDKMPSITKNRIAGTEILIMGTKTHVILGKIECKQEPSSTYPSGNYQYTLFNTGNGASQFHRDSIEEGIRENQAHPLIYDEVPKTALSYDFFYELFRLSLQSSEIEKVYEWHNQNLVIKAGGIKKMSQDYYNRQQKGTCAFSSIEALIKVHLNGSQIKDLERTTINCLVNQQAKIVEFLDFKAKIGQESACKLKKKRERQEPFKPNKKRKINGAILSPEQRVKNARALLELGKKARSSQLN